MPSICFHPLGKATPLVITGGTKMANKMEALPWFWAVHEKLALKKSVGRISIVPETCKGRNRIPHMPRTSQAHNSDDFVQSLVHP